MSVKQATFEDYDGFVAKFEPKKTTDDCMTPAPVYEAVRDWAVREYGLEGRVIVRPFWPGGDYETFDYPDGCVVIDNPPFSILTRICRFYAAAGIDYFLFAPHLTCFSADVPGRNYIPCGVNVHYENRANVSTSFVTSLGDSFIRSAPDLHRAATEASAVVRRAKTKHRPKYAYPPELLIAANVARYSQRGIDFRVRRSETARATRLDSQKPLGKAIFGGGFLLSEDATARKNAAERAAAERAAAERFDLSPRERDIVRSLGRPRQTETAE